MRYSLIAPLAATALVLSACGGGTSSADAAKGFIAFGDAVGIELDADCVEDLAGELSSADKKVVAAIVDDPELNNEPQLTEEGDAIGERVFSECVAGG